MQVAPNGAPYYKDSNTMTTHWELPQVTDALERKRLREEKAMVEVGKARSRANLLARQESARKREVRNSLERVRT